MESKEAATCVQRRRIGSLGQPARPHRSLPLAWPLNGSAARAEWAAQPRRLESPPQEARAVGRGTAKMTL